MSCSQYYNQKMYNFHHRFQINFITKKHNDLLFFILFFVDVITYFIMNSFNKLFCIFNNNLLLPKIVSICIVIYSGCIKNFKNLNTFLFTVKRRNRKTNKFTPSCPARLF